MNCYVCAQRDSERTAVGLCHNCSAGLCIEHAHEKCIEVTNDSLINRIMTLPLKARQLLCHLCKQALEQPRRVT
jgi:hypothetical protein